MECFICESMSSSSSSSSTQVDPIFSLSSELSVPEKRRTGRKKFKETRHPIYRGVRRKNGDKWVCEVREPNKKSRIWVGTFSSPELAARAHDVAALALKDNFAILNFTDSAFALPRAKSSSPKDIRAAALEASKAFIHSSLRNPNSQIYGSSSQLCSNKEDEPKPIYFLDEEALFNMPLLLDMAEGLLLTPPAIRMGFYWDHDVDFAMDLTSLWEWM